MNLWQGDGWNWPGEISRANLKNGRGSFLKYWMSNMACGSGRSGKSTARRAYTPSRDLKSGMPQDTETPAPVRTMMLELFLIKETQSSKVLTPSSFFLRGGSESRLKSIFHIVMLSRLSGISLPEGRRVS